MTRKSGDVVSFQGAFGGTYPNVDYTTIKGHLVDENNVLVGSEITFSKGGSTGGGGGGNVSSNAINVDGTLLDESKYSGGFGGECGTKFFYINTGQTKDGTGITLGFNLKRADGANLTPGLYVYRPQRGSDPAIYEVDPFEVSFGGPLFVTSYNESTEAQIMITTYVPGSKGKLGHAVGYFSCTLEGPQPNSYTPGELKTVSGTFDVSFLGE